MSNAPKESNPENNKQDSSEQKIPSGMEPVGEIIAKVEINNETVFVGKVATGYADPHTAEVIAAHKHGYGGNAKACLAADEKFGEGYQGIFGKRPLPGEESMN